MTQEQNVRPTLFDCSTATWVFVGCGGTFYCAVPYLKVLLAKFRPEWVTCWDPDQLEAKNVERQWPGKLDGSAKAILGADSIYERSYGQGRSLYSGRIGEFPSDAGYAGPVLLVVNVDSNKARMECRQWCIDRSATNPTVMVVSGCDGAKGQAYWGAWVPQSLMPDGHVLPTGAVEWHDWLSRHPDVAEDAEEDRRDGACGGQTIFANAVTGALVGMAIENVHDWGQNSGIVREFYWSDEGDLFRAWEANVVPSGAIAMRPRKAVAV